MSKVKRKMPKILFGRSLSFCFYHDALNISLYRTASTSDAGCITAAMSISDDTLGESLQALKKKKFFAEVVATLIRLVGITIDATLQLETPVAFRITPTL